MEKHIQVYKKYWGVIPHDEKGRIYDIHHLDYNHKNNDPWNLVALPIKVHYIVHELQHHWGACQAIAVRMKLSPEIISDLAGKGSNNRIANGTHNFLGGELSRKVQAKRIADGTHNFLDSVSQRKNANNRIANGTHNFIQLHTCLYCGKEGKGAVMFRYHFNNCKLKASKQ